MRARRRLVARRGSAELETLFSIAYTAPSFTTASSSAPRPLASNRRASLAHLPIVPAGRGVLVTKRFFLLLLAILACEGGLFGSAQSRVPPADVSAAQPGAYVVYVADGAAGTGSATRIAITNPDPASRQ